MYSKYRSKRAYARLDAGSQISQKFGGVYGWKKKKRHFFLEQKRSKIASKRAHHFSIFGDDY